MSFEDIIAERDVISYPARVTKHPLVGLTIGSDGYWSARWWEAQEKMSSDFGVTSKSSGAKAYELYGHPESQKRNAWSDRLRRTEDCWGLSVQRNLEALNVGVVGIGSIGSIAAEAFARVGVGSLTLIDSDRVEEHNLDRLLHGTEAHLGDQKTRVAAESLKEHATNASFVVNSIDMEIQYTAAYRAALDCGHYSKLRRSASRA